MWERFKDSWAHNSELRTALNQHRILCEQEHVHLQQYQELEHDFQIYKQTTRSEQKQLQEQHHIKESGLRHKHEVDTAQLKELHTDNVRRLVSSRDAQVRELNQKYQSLESAKNTELQKLTQICNEKVRALDRNCDVKLRELQHTSNVKLQETQKLHEEREAEMTKVHQVGMQHLLRDLREANSALLARDADRPVLSIFKIAEFENTPDEHVKAQFADLVNQVDTLCRLGWKEEQQVWTIAQLKDFDNDANLRMLRKALLQDRVWTAFHSYIFCSPFRVLGEEGQLIEGEWCKDYGSDPTFVNGSFVWPKPSFEVERWRYFTVYGCREALRENLSQWDPRNRLRQSFLANVEQLITELQSSLAEVVSPDDLLSTNIRQLARRASKMWLEFALRRCRIVLDIGGSRSLSFADQLYRAQKGELRLTIVPRLGKYGDSQGVGLENYTIIGGYDGEVRELAQLNSDDIM